MAARTLSLHDTAHGAPWPAPRLLRQPRRTRTAGREPRGADWPGRRRRRERSGQQEAPGGTRSRAALAAFVSLPSRAWRDGGSVVSWSSAPLEPSRLVPRGAPAPALSPSPQRSSRTGAPYPPIRNPFRRGQPNGPQRKEQEEAFLVTLGQLLPNPDPPRAKQSGQGRISLCQGALPKPSSNWGALYVLWSELS